MVSLHIPAYNEPPELVQQTLRALARLDYPNYEVIVVDNGSTDRTSDVALSLGALLSGLAASLAIASASRAGFAAGGVIIRQGHVTAGARRTFLKNCGQKIFRAPLLRIAQVFAVARAIVEPYAAGHRLSFYYATQVTKAPPTFLLFVNRDELFSDSYTKYLTNEMRRAFGFEGCPLVMVPKPRPKTIAPIRKYR